MARVSSGGRKLGKSGARAYSADVMLKPVDYDRQQHQVYAKGRALSAQVMADWMATFGAHLPARRPLRLLDLGSGTGRFSPALAETFGGPVIGVEPSERMRAAAEVGAIHPSVRYVAGEAGAIPLEDASVDGVLMFLSFHHVKDKPAAAREVARVLKPDGTLLLRSTFADRVPADWWRPFFPRVQAIEEAMFPLLAHAQAVFAAAGLDRAERIAVERPFEGTLAEQAEKLKLRAISIFEHLSEAEWAEGCAAMDAAVAAGAVADAEPRTVDLLVLSRT